MERTPPTSIGEFAAILRRRKYWIVVPFVLVLALGITLAPYVPRTYQSTATIMVQPQKVSTAYVRPPSSSEVINRIDHIELGVMNGPDLVRIIRQHNLYPRLRQKATMNHVIAAMRKDLTVAIAPDAGAENGHVNAFTISYVGRTPQESQQVTSEIAQLYIQQSLNEGHRQAVGAASFLTAQVAEAGQQLAVQKAKIQAFKAAHLGSLPEQAQANLTLINQYQMDLQSNSTAIDQDNQQRVYLESVLNVNPKGNTVGVAPIPLTPLQVELAQKQSELHADLLKYTPEHPDVIRLRHDIAVLQAQIRQAPRVTGKAAVPVAVGVVGPSKTDLLRGQLTALNTEIKSRYAREKTIQAKLDHLQAAASTAPAVQTEYSSLDSQYQEMQKSYNELLEKQRAASMAAALYRNDDSEQLVVIQPATLPIVPYRPDPALLYMGTFLLAILAGCVCAAIVELRDDTMHSASEVAAYLKLPVMVSLPKFVT